MAPSFTRIGEFQLVKVIQSHYQIGEIGIDIPIELSREQFYRLEKMMRDYFGEDSFLLGDIRYAVATFPVGSKRLRKEFDENLLKEKDARENSSNK